MKEWPAGGVPSLKPPWPKVESSVPLVFSRATRRLDEDQEGGPPGTSSWPATTILPSGWMVTAAANSLVAVAVPSMSSRTYPAPPPKVVSGVPLALNRATKASAPPSTPVEYPPPRSCRWIERDAVAEYTANSRWEESGITLFVERRVQDAIGGVPRHDQPVGLIAHRDNLVVGLDDHTAEVNGGPAELGDRVPSGLAAVAEPLLATVENAARSKTGHNPRGGDGFARWVEGVSGHDNLSGGLQADSRSDVEA